MTSNFKFIITIYTTTTTTTTTTKCYYTNIKKSLTGNKKFLINFLVKTID